MADVYVPLPSPSSTPLPPVCVGCGRVGTWQRRVRILGTPIGVSLVVAPPAHAAANSLERMMCGPGSIDVPVCWWHRWIVPPTVEVSVAGSRLRLTDVSEEFAAAIPRG